MNGDRDYTVNILRLRAEYSQMSCSVLFIFREGLFKYTVIQFTCILLLFIKLLTSKIIIYFHGLKYEIHAVIKISH